MSFESDKPCICCGLEGEGMVTYHHEYAQKSFPEFKHSKWNLVSLCLKHHNMVHSNGTVTVSEKFPSLENWLIQNGWEIFISGTGAAQIKKWVHYGKEL